MAIAAVGAALSTAAGVAIGTIAASQAVTYFLVTTAMGAALNALAPKPNIPSGSNTANRGLQVSTRGARQDHQIIYGQTRVGGAIVFDAVSGANNKVLHRVIAYAGHEIEEFSTFYFNDEALTLTTDTDSNGDTYYKPTTATDKQGNTSNRYNDYVRIYQRKGGSSNNTAIQALIQAGVDWTADHKLQGIAYAYYRIEYNADSFPNGVPEMTAVIKGKKVYDPRDATTAWSDNPALCVRDYLTNSAYGLGEGASSIDDDQVKIAADVCDHTIYGRGASSTAINVTIQYFDGSDQANLIYEGPHSILVGDKVQLDDSTYPTLLFNILGVDETSLDGDLVVSAVTSLDFTVPVTMDAPMSGSGVVEQAGTYTYYHTEGGDQRFTCDGAFTTAVTPHDHLLDLLGSMGGVMWYGQGKWRMKAAHYTQPALTFTLDDVRSSIQVGTRHSRRDNFNTVKGTFRGPDTDYQPTDYAEVTNQAFRDADNGQISTYDLDLPFTDSFDIARRIALITLERNRQQLTVQATFGMKAFQTQVGDVVRLTMPRFGWTNKEFEVMQWTFGLQDGNDLQVQLVLREISESVFDDISDGVVYERDNTTLLSPFEVPAVAIAPANEYGGVFKVVSEKLLREMQLNVTTSDASRINYVEVQYRPASTGDYLPLGQGDVGRYSVLDLDEGNYDARVRGVNTFGVKGDWSYATNFLLAPLDTPPADLDPADISFEISQGTIFINWEPIADLDLSYYQLKHTSDTTISSVSEANTAWGTSNIVVKRVARPATSVALPARSGTFTIKAVDKAGNYSDNAGYVVVPATALPVLGNNTIQTETNDFNTTGNTNVSVDTSANPDELTINSTTAANPTGTYTFGGDLSGSQTQSNADYIDVTTARTVTASSTLTQARHIDYAQTWDNIPQTWDTWPDTWDDWTNEDANFGDFSSVVEVRATSDDPSGSPTWGDWGPADGSQYVGRAFQFRVRLNATNTGVSPAITALTGKISF
jgi:hypothetical protein